MKPKARAAALVLVLLGFTVSAQAARFSEDRPEGADYSAIRTVAFLPFAAVAPPGESDRAVCPVHKESFTPCEIDEAAEAELSRAIGRVLPASGAPVKWTPQSEINAARAKLKKEGHLELDTRGSWQRAIANELGVDAVMFGFIYCYRDRSGNAFASAVPAALGFCLHLVDPKTGKVLWSFRYEDQQMALSDNLLELPEFLKRGGKWIPVSRMAEEAAVVTAKNLPWLEKPEKGKEEK